MNNDYEEAIEHIARNLLDGFSKRIALEAIEKQVPTKPITSLEDHEDHFDIKVTCPTCNKLIGYYEDEDWDEEPFKRNNQYCKHCGQKLLWENK